MRLQVPQARFFSSHNKPRQTFSAAASSIFLHGRIPLSEATGSSNRTWCGTSVAPEMLNFYFIFFFSCCWSLDVSANCTRTSKLHVTDEMQPYLRSFTAELHEIEIITRSTEVILLLVPPPKKKKMVRNTCAGCETHFLSLVVYQTENSRFHESLGAGFEIICHPNDTWTDFSKSDQILSSIWTA